MAVADTFTPTVDELVEQLHSLMKTGYEKVLFETPHGTFEMEGLILRGDDQMVVCLRQVKNKSREGTQ